MEQPEDKGGSSACLVLVCTDPEFALQSVKENKKLTARQLCVSEQAFSLLPEEPSGRHPLPLVPAGHSHHKAGGTVSTGSASQGLSVWGTCDLRKALCETTKTSVSDWAL